MKCLITLSTLLFFVTFSFAQTASVDNSSQTKAVSVTSTAMNKSAIKEMSLHLQKTLVVPSRLKEYKIGGQSMVQVHLDDQGQISKIEIIKSLDSSLDKEILKSLNKIKKINAVTVDGVARAQVIRFPVTIKH